MPNFFGATSLTGGAAGALDDILHTEISDGDGAIVIDAVNDKAYEYTYDSSSSAAESPPTIIQPDSNAGNGRWVLTASSRASLALASGATVTEISTDDTLAGASDTALVTEGSIKTYVDNAIAAISTITLFPGFVNRPRFGWNATNAIWINPGAYEHNGTSQQMCFWDSALVFELGSGGSNSDSTDLAANDWFYVYIDDSAVVTAGTNELTASEFVAVTTAPTYSVAKHGYYNGNDRCICAVKTNSSSEITKFVHDGGDYLEYSDQVSDRGNAALPTSLTAVTLTIPDFGNYTKARVTFYLLYTSGSVTGSYQNTDAGSSDLHWIGRVTSTMPISFMSREVMADDNQQINIIGSDAGANLLIATNGYYFPRGM